LIRQAKLCVVGGGGVRTPFVAKTVATNAAKAGIKQLVLQDNDEFKLNKYGMLAKEIARRIDPDLQVILESSPAIALKDCDYIISSIRVGGDVSRKTDQQIVEKYNLLAQETTGACGFAMAMRSIPTLIEYCEIAKKVSKPDHIIFNFTNPAGLVTQALNKLGFPVYGICDSPTELIKQLAAMLDVEEMRFGCNSFGLNHLTWFNNFTIDGISVDETVINHPELFNKTEMRIFDQDILTISDNHLLNEYLYFYFYAQKTMRLSNKSDLSRAELIEKVNEKMNAELDSINVSEDFDTAIRIYFDNYNVRENSYLQNESGVPRVKTYTTPTAAEFIQKKDEGGYSGVALRFITALASDHETNMVLSVPNNGAIAELKNDDVIEVMCKIAGGQVTPNIQNEIPTSIMNLIQTVKEYERLAVQAILESNTDLAIKALTVNPLVANHDIAKSLVEEFISAYGSYGNEWR
jgi:6-phospho-beta-glucosidase